MTSVGGEGSSNGDRKFSGDGADIKINSFGEDGNEPKPVSSTNGSKPSSISLSSIPQQVFGMGTGNREGLRLSLENNLSSGSSSSLMLTTPTMTSTSISPGNFLLPPTLLTPGTLNLLNTPTSSNVLGLVASSPAGAPTLTTPTLTPTTLRNIEQMFLEHEELGFGGSHSSESHENAAHFVPPPVAADDLSKSLKDEASIKQEKPTITSISTMSSPSSSVGMIAGEHTYSEFFLHNVNMVNEKLRI